MRSIVMSVAAVALAIPSPVWAIECPDKVDGKTERGFGEVKAWLGDDRPVYQPGKLQKLGEQVAYVIVDRVLTWDGQRYAVAGIERLRFRLAGVSGNSDTLYPERIRKAFDKAYKSAGCENGGELVCQLEMDASSQPGALLSAELSEGNLVFGSDAYGPALPLIQADEEMIDASPAFLVCDYQVQT